MNTRQQPVAVSAARRALLVAAVGWVAAGATAQETTYLQEKPERSALAQRVYVDQVLNGQTSFAENRQAVTDYFNKYYFPAMTYAAVAIPKVSQQGPLNSTADRRGKFIRQLRRSRNPQAAQFVTQLALAKMRTYATQNFHPTVRVNAVLLIGDLDADPGNTAPGRQPQPLPATLPVLVGFLQDEQMPDVTKVAALVGLHRHAAAGLPEDARADVTELMLQLVGTAQAPPGRSVDGHTWMRQQAAEILGLLGSAGEQGRVLQALTETLKEKGAPLWLRCAAAAALGQLKLEGAETDTSQVVVSLGRYAGDAIRDAVARARAAESEVERARTRAPFAGRRETAAVVVPGAGRRDNVEQPGTPTIFPRATLAYRTLCARKALEAIQEAANAQAQEQAQQLLDLLQSLYEMMEVDLEYPRQEVDINRVSMFGKQIQEIFAKPGTGRENPGEAEGEQAGQPEASEDVAGNLSVVLQDVTAG